MEKPEYKRDQEEVNKRIKAEIQKLNKQFTNIDDKSKKLVTSLIENAAFMIVTLEDLQKEINEKGPVSVYQNGENQWGTKKSPEVDVYNTMIKNHMAIMKQLTELSPVEEKPKESDGFDSFVMNRD